MCHIRSWYQWAQAAIIAIGVLAQHEQTSHAYYLDKGDALAVNVIPLLLSEEYALYGSQAYQRLQYSIHAHHKYFNHNLQDKPFADLLLSLPIPSELLHHGKSHGTQDDKYFIGSNTIKKRGKDYVAYAFGTAGQVDFENCRLPLTMLV